jgi:hypothetical protein
VHAIKYLKTYLTYVAPSALLIAFSGCTDTASAPGPASDATNDPSATTLRGDGDRSSAPAVLDNSDAHDDAVDDAEDVSWVEQDTLLQGNAMLRLLLTDAPIAADNVFVTFCGVYAERAREPLEASDSEHAEDDSVARDGGASRAEHAEDDATLAGAADRIDRGLPTQQADTARGDAGVAVRPVRGSDAERRGWHPLSEECRTVDLLTMRDGITEALGAAGLPAGKYTSIRLLLTGAAIVIDGSQHELFVPSGAESGLKIGGEFSLEPGVASTLTIDFDAAASVHHAPGRGYILVPVIGVVGDRRHAPEAHEGAVRNTVEADPGASSR